MDWVICLAVILALMLLPALTLIVAMLFQNTVTREVFIWTSCISVMACWILSVMGISYGIVSLVG